MGQYLTPESATGQEVCRVFRIPQELNQYFTGALELLTKGWMWETFGTLTAGECAELFRGILDSEEDCSVDKMLGTVIAWVQNYTPDWLLQANGQTILKADYPALWEMWRDDKKTATELTLPAMRRRFLRGTTLSSNFTTGGEDDQSISVAEMPAHTHTIQQGYGPGLAFGPGPAGPPVSWALATPETTSSRGDGDNFDNRPDFFHVTWMVVVK